MIKLRLGPIEDDKPVKVTIELPAAVSRDLELYAKLLSEFGDQPPISEPAKLIVPMVEKFMAGDRAFTKARRAKGVALPGQETGSRQPSP